MSQAPKIGMVVTGTVVKVFPTYAIMLFDEGWTGLLHISELSHSFIRSFTSFVTVGTIYTVKVVDISAGGSKVHVSLKQVTNSERKHSFAHRAIDECEVSFDSLRDHLPRWIEQQNKEIVQ